MNNYCTLPRDRSLHLFLQISNSTTLSQCAATNPGLTGGIGPQELLKFVEIMYHNHSYLAAAGND